MVDNTLACAGGETSKRPRNRLIWAALLVSLADEASDKGQDCTYGGPEHLESIWAPRILKRAFWNLIDMP